MIQARLGKLWGYGFWLLIASLAAMLPVLSLGPPKGHSFVHNLAWLEAFEASFWSGEFYPRWMAGLWGGAGGADFFFYAPLPFWITSLFNGIFCFACSAQDKLVVGGILVLFFSGASFYFFVSKHVDAKSALVAAILYMALPYHLAFDWYVRQAFAEMAGYVFLPLIAHFLISLFHERRGGLGLALSFAGLALTHLPFTVIAAFFVAAITIYYRVFANAPPDQRQSFLLQAILWLAIGALLSAFYWLPALALIGDVTPGFMYQPYYTWNNWLFFDGKPEPNPQFTTMLEVQLVGVSALAGMCLYGLRREAGEWTWWAILSIALGWFFVTPLSSPLWMYLTLLQKIQFPWRFLALVDFGVAVVLAFALARIIAGDNMFTRLGRRIRPIPAGLVAIIAVTAGAFAMPLLPSTFKDHFDSKPHQQAFILPATEYLPSHAFAALDRFISNPAGKTPGLDPRFSWQARLAAVAEVTASAPQARATIERSGNRERILKISAPEAVDVVVKQFYWKHWIAQDQASQKSIEMRPDERFGLTVLRLAPGEHFIKLELPLLKAELIGLLVSALAALAALLIGVFPKFFGPRSSAPIHRQ